MLFKGGCICGHWSLSLEYPKSTLNLNPRICDCKFCQKDSSQVISAPDMISMFSGGSTVIKKNGDQLANFHYCSNCAQLLAVGRNLHGVYRGAINISLLSDNVSFGKPFKSQPRLLSAKEKLVRWGQLWGVIVGM